MMPKDKDGVVDTKLKVPYGITSNQENCSFGRSKVYGTKNLRVADLSILPIIPSVHTQGT